MDEFLSAPEPTSLIQYPSTVNPTFDIGMITEDAMRLLRNGFAQFAAIFLAIQVPLVLVQMFALPPSDQPQGDLGDLGNAILIAVFFGFLGLFASLNIIIAARNNIAGAARPFYLTFVNAMIRFPTAVFAAIPFFFAVSFGLIALIIPGLIIYIFACFFIEAIAITDRRVIASLVESVELVKGNWWRVFALKMILLITVALITAPLLLFDTFATPPLLLRIPIYLFVSALGVVITLFDVMMFYNLLAVRANRTTV
jgi:hypothetical protein